VAQPAALRRFNASEVRFGCGWRLGGITFRVFFIFEMNGDSQRRGQSRARKAEASA